MSVVGISFFFFFTGSVRIVRVSFFPSLSLSVALGSLRSYENCARLISLKKLSFRDSVSSDGLDLLCFLHFYINCPVVDLIINGSSAVDVPSSLYY